MNDINRAPSTLKARSRRGFTLIEILVVIGIIVVLLGILIPVVSKVRKSARVATVQAQINDIQGSIQQYQQDHGALPGPLPYNQIRLSTFNLTMDTTGLAAAGFDAAALEADKITMAENLVLGLAGGLKYDTGAGTNPIQYDPRLVGGGAMSLNPGSPKKGRSYIDQKNLSWRTPNTGKTGKYEDGAGAADDSKIPEILDTFPSPLPILYLRARKGQQPPPGDAANWDVDTNFIITHSTTSPGPRIGQYDMSQIIGYLVPPTAGGGFIGEGKSISASEYMNSPTPPSPGKFPHGLTPPDPSATMDKGATTYEYPYNSFPYFRDPSSSTTSPQPRAKDGYILISAGLDRVYGTEDDVTSFGPVAP